MLIYTRILQTPLGVDLNKNYFNIEIYAEGGGVKEGIQLNPEAKYNTHLCTIL